MCRQTKLQKEEKENKLIITITIVENMKRMWVDVCKRERDGGELVGNELIRNSIVDNILKEEDN